jgi:hypothetical protein
VTTKEKLRWAQIRVDAALIELKLGYELIAELKPFEAEQLTHVGGLLARIRDRLK